MLCSALILGLPDTRPSFGFGFGFDFGFILVIWISLALAHTLPNKHRVCCVVLTHLYNSVLFSHSLTEQKQSVMNFLCLIFQDTDSGQSHKMMCIQRNDIPIEEYVALVLGSVGLQRVGVGDGGSGSTLLQPEMVESSEHGIQTIRIRCCPLLLARDNKLLQQCAKRRWHECAGEADSAPACCLIEEEETLRKKFRRVSVIVHSQQQSVESNASSSVGLVEDDIEMH